MAVASRTRAPTSMNLRGDPDRAGGDPAGDPGAPLVERRSAGIEALVHGVGPDAKATVLAMARPRRHLVRGEALYVAGSPASALYLVHAGTVKSLVGLQDGRRQAVGYHIVGDVVGLPGLATGTHPDDAVACEDVEIATLDYAELARLARAHPRLHANLTRLLAVATSGGRDAMLRLRSGKASARLAAFLIALERRLAQRGVPAGALPVVYNGVDLDDIPFSDNPDEFFLITGRMLPEKGIADAIRIVSRIKAKLLIVGHVTSHVPWSEEYFLKEVKPHIDGNKICYVERLAHGDLMRIMSKAKAFLFPIKWDEPFGMVVVEAMAAGTPVLAYERGSMPELIKNGETGYLVRSEDEMFERMQRLQTLDRAHCRQWVQERFSVEQMIDGYERLYQSAPIGPQSQKIIAKPGHGS